MKDPTEIRELSYQRLQEAKILYDNDKFDGAFYLAGYSVELSLKAKICEKLGIPNLLDDSSSDSIQIKGINEIRKAIRTHNLFLLLVFSGLKKIFDKDKAWNRSLAKANSLMFNKWDENIRYRCCGSISEEDARETVNLLSEENGLLSWIEAN